jgi:SAM-dependent methyltransferase
MAKREKQSKKQVRGNEWKLQTPHRELLPPHTADELAALRASFELHGVLDQIEVADSASILLDGHARYDWLLSQKKAIPSKIFKLVGGLTATAAQQAWILAKHLGKRSTPPTRAQRRQYIDILLMANSYWSDVRLAEMVGVSPSTILRRRQELVQMHKIKKVDATVGKDGIQRRVKRQGTTDRATGRMIDHRVDKRLSDLPVVSNPGTRPDRLGKMLDNIADLSTTPRLLSARCARTLAKQAAAREKALSAPDRRTTGCDVYHCDFRKLPVKPHSIDLILTDVLWAKKYAPDWKSLAQWATGVLKPDGLLCTLHAPCSIPESLDAFRSGGLHYVFSGCAVNNQAQPMPVVNVLNFWRPIWIFGLHSGKRNWHGAEDTYVTPQGKEQKEKLYHDFQQPVAVFRWLVRWLSEPSHLVCDPMCGTGTTGVACRQEGRTFIGGDHDAKMVKTARYRIATEGLVRAG